MKAILKHNFIRFLIVGVLNTLIGYGTFYLLFRYFQIQPYLANAIGYVVALAVAFSLSKDFVFEKSYRAGMVTKFIFAFLLSFGLNQLVLFLLISNAYIIPELAQVVAMASYTLTFYFLNKHFVFGR